MYLTLIDICMRLKAKSVDLNHFMCNTSKTSQLVRALKCPYGKMV